MNSNQDNDIKQHFQELIDNPDLKEISSLVVDLINESATQMQANILQTVLSNTIIDVLVDKGLTDYDTFMKKYEKNLEEADKRLLEDYQRAVQEDEQMQKESTKEEEKDKEND